MLTRHIDATVADFLSALVRYGIIAFTLIAALGRVGVQTASVIAVLGAAGLAVGLALQGSLATWRLAFCWSPSVRSAPVNMSIWAHGGYRAECADFLHHAAFDRR